MPHVQEMQSVQTNQSVQSKQSCKICGSPSLTVICMHCFLNYNYKVYAGSEEEEQQLLSTSGMQHSKTTAHEDDVYRSFERKRINENEDESGAHQPFSLSSIFARLPRFE